MVAEREDQATYTVLARRYRPNVFEECIGQEHVAQALRNAIQTGRVAHAYLFTGSRGVGKTSMARIFAKALNCENGPTVEPCGQCESCLAIAAGSDLDVVEIDGASNRGIEEIRELRQGVAYRPSRSRYKIYIIDEVHMLTKEAFNALLKTLEEPPAHVKFLFATTEPQKIPITILSRCQRYDFAGIGPKEIEDRLREIVAAEGMTADEEAIEIIARRARGSMRDSQSLLDQVLAYASGRVTAEMVHNLLGTSGEDRVAELVASVLSQDAAACLRLVESAMGQGVQLGEWIEQTLDYFRDLLVLGLDENAPLLSMPSRMRSLMLEQGRSVPAERLLEMMDILAACRTRMRSITFARTLFEMTLVRLCRLDSFLNLSAALASGPPPATATQASRTPAASQRPVSSAVAASSKKNEVQSHRTNGEVESNRGAADGEPAMPDPLGDGPPAVELTVESFQQVWSQTLAGIADPVLAAMLAKAASVRFQAPTNVVIAFPASAATSRRHCEEHAETIRDACQRVCGRRVAVAFEQSEQSADPATNPPAVRSSLQLREQAMRDPLVRQAEELLGAKIIDVAWTPVPASTRSRANTMEEDSEGH